jgi:ankyrin repeat protein
MQFLLIDHRQDMNSLGFEDESTPLHAAVSGSYLGAASVTRVLLEFGADVMAQDQYGCTPLHHAAGSWSSRAMEVVRVLLGGGADAMAQDKHARTPLHHVARSLSSQAMEIM